MKSLLKKIQIKKNAGQSTSWSLLLVSIPLILSSLSGSLMLLCDRLFLAHYSLTALNSMVVIGSVILMLQIGMNVIASIAEVFVGQLNGADKELELSQPTWQMIWFSLSTLVLFLPLSFSVEHLFLMELSSQDEIFYTKLLIAICPLSPLSVALSTFFIGRKQTGISFLSTFFGNCTNLILNYLLIFGVERLQIPAMGIKGAGIATAVAQGVALLVLILAFFSRKNKSQYRTLYAKFDPLLFLKMLRVGYPNAVAQAMIAAAWSCFFMLISKLGEVNVTLASIMQTLTGFFVFLVQGLSRGVTTISANLIGKKEFSDIPKILFSGIRLILLFGIGIFSLFWLFPSEVVKMLFNSTDYERVFSYFETFKQTFFWGWMTFLFKSIRALLSGILTSSGKTQFIMWNEVLSIWFVFVFPIWFFIEFFAFDISRAYFIAFIYNVLVVILYYRKFCSINWEREASLV
jgi:MATE family multidrug resistance protein